MQKKFMDCWLQKVHKKIDTSNGICSFFVHEHPTERRTKHSFAVSRRGGGAIRYRSRRDVHHLAVHSHRNVRVRFPLHHSLRHLSGMQHRRGRRMPAMLVRRPLRPEQLVELIIIHRSNLEFRIV